MPVKIEKGGKPIPFLREPSQAVLRNLKARGYAVSEGVTKHALTEEDRKVRGEGDARKVPMKIKMLTTKKGSTDGITVNEYKAGEIYEIPTGLASIFLCEGWAEEVK